MCVCVGGGGGGGEGVRVYSRETLPLKAPYSKKKDIFFIQERLIN